MTRGDFELIARTLQQYHGDAPELIEMMAETFARKLSNTNANFNYARFVATARGEMT